MLWTQSLEHWTLVISLAKWLFCLSEDKKNSFLLVLYSTEFWAASVLNSFSRAQPMDKNREEFYCLNTIWTWRGLSTWHLEFNCKKKKWRNTLFTQDNPALWLRHFHCALANHSQLTQEQKSWVDVAHWAHLNSYQDHIPRGTGNNYFHSLELSPLGN